MDSKLQEVSKRNTISFEAGLKDAYAKIYAQNETINQLFTGLSALQERMNSLEQQLIIQKVQLTGLGPSVRG